MVREREQRHRQRPVHVSGEPRLGLRTAGESRLRSGLNAVSSSSGALPRIAQQCGVCQVVQQGVGGVWSGNRGGSVQGVVAAAAAAAFVHAAEAAAAALGAGSLLLALRFAGHRQGVVSFYGSSWDWHSIHHSIHHSVRKGGVVWC